QVMVERRVRTEGERFAAILGGKTKARVLIEASTESEWVARCIEALGHEVIVADPSFVAMYATRSRRAKTGRGDRRGQRAGGRGATPPQSAAGSEKGPGGDTHPLYFPHRSRAAAARTEGSQRRCGVLYQAGREGQPFWAATFRSGASLGRLGSCQRADSILGWRPGTTGPAGQASGASSHSA